MRVSIELLVIRYTVDISPRYPMRHARNTHYNFMCGFQYDARNIIYVAVVRFSLSVPYYDVINITAGS
jgi:hypothetical protein